MGRKHVDSLTVIKMRDSGMSLSSIATELGVSVFLIWRILKENSKHGLVPWEDLDRAKEMYSLGISISKIGTLLGKTTSFVYFRFKAEGIEIRRVWTKLDINDALAMRESGATLQQIGDKYGLTRERVRQILTKRGFSRCGAETAKMKRDAEIAKHEEEIVSAYNNGLSVPKTSSKAGVSKRLVHECLDSNGISTSRRYLRTRAEINLKEFVTLYKTMGYFKLRDHYNCSVGTIQKLRADLNLPVRKAGVGPRPRFTAKEIRFLDELIESLGENQHLSVAQQRKEKSILAPAVSP